MTTESMNRKLAEWMGWTFQPMSGPLHCPWVAPDKDRYPDHPCYTASRDAVADVEARMTQAQRVDYANELGRVCGTQHEKIFATAMQKVHALCRILGLLKEAEKIIKKHEKKL